ncbi:MAG: hypothetical protein K6G70_04015 [Bacteroidaceae bacterium]|nr:hypothetical protein [Bacteroidaceae bacterium]
MKYEKLCRAIEEQLHREMHTPADFEYLSEQLQRQTGDSVSSTTLMRLWGYRPSVTVRTSTLDILARFIGYEDYTHFNSACMEEDAQAEPAGIVEEVKEKPSRFHYGYMAAAVAVIVVCAGMFLFFSLRFRPTEEVAAQRSQPHFITKLSELGNNRKYLIHTRRDRRGILGISSRHLASTYGIARFYHCDEPSPFALIQYEDNYYLYSVQEDLFVNVLQYLTNQPLRQDFGKENWCAFDIRPERGCFVIDFKSHTKVYTLNVNAGDGIIIDDWGTTNGTYDDGNLFILEDVGPFDPTEAFILLQNSLTD